MHLNSQRGTSLVEVILYIALLLVFMGAMIDFSLGMITDSVKIRTIQDVQHNVRLSLQGISRDIRSADDIKGGTSIFDESEGVLVLEKEGVEMTYFMSGSSLFKRNQKDSEPISLTPTNLRVKEFLLEAVGDENDPEGVRIVLTFFHQNPSGKNEFEWTESLQTTVNLR